MAKGKFIGLNDEGRRVGETHHRAKLTDHDIELIRRLREAKPPMSIAEIAKKFDVCKGLVSRIVNYKHRAQIATRWKKFT